MTDTADTGPIGAAAAAAVATDHEAYDAADWRNLPHGRYCMVYGDGHPGGFDIPTAAQVASIGAPDHRVITVRGNGRIASIIDGRPDNNLDDPTVRGFVRERIAMRASVIIYTPRAFVRGYQRALLDAGDTPRLYEYPRLYWWIATLDGHPWTATELAADLADHWDALLAPDRMWAVQYDQQPQLGPTARVDVSRLFMDFRPKP